VQTSVDPSTQDGRGRFTRRTIAASFGVGWLVALATSAGIAGERITRAALPMVVLANAVATLAGVLAIVVTMRPMLVLFDGAERPRKLHTFAVLAAQIVGAVAGIAVVHLVLRREALAAVPWLSERPAQWVNDAVAVFGLLAIVWACARGLDLRLLVLALVGVTLYRVTSPMWHVDQAPGVFPISIQQLVVAQFVAAALALSVFRATVDRTAR
jgi:hypothetical protein